MYVCIHRKGYSKSRSASAAGARQDTSLEQSSTLLSQRRASTSWTTLRASRQRKSRAKLASSPVHACRRGRRQVTSLEWILSLTGQPPGPGAGIATSRETTATAFSVVAVAVVAVVAAAVAVGRVAIVAVVAVVNISRFVVVTGPADLAAPVDSNAADIVVAAAGSGERLMLIAVSMSAAMRLRFSAATPRTRSECNLRSTQA